MDSMLVFAGHLFGFDSKKEAEEFINMIFSCSKNRMALYEEICLSAGEYLVAISQSQVTDKDKDKSKLIVEGMQVLINLYGKIYDPSSEIFSLDDKEEFTDPAAYMIE